MRGLPVHRGYPVPKFVAWINGEPDFRVMSNTHFKACLQFRLCWLCGEKLGANIAFVIGPMCAVNRVSSEPPSHRECAIFGATACPFLARPEARRREAGLPEHKPAAGCSIQRNPGVALVWVTRNAKAFNTPREEGIGTGVLFDVGQPQETLWFARGRAATREEVQQSVDEGMPALLGMAESDGPVVLSQLRVMAERATLLFPPAEVAA